MLFVISHPEGRIFYIFQKSGKRFVAHSELC